MKRISAVFALFGLVMGLLVSGCEKQDSTIPATDATNAPPVSTNL